MPIRCDVDGTLALACVACVALLIRLCDLTPARTPQSSLSLLASDCLSLIRRACFVPSDETRAFEGLRLSLSLRTPTRLRLDWIALPARHCTREGKL